MPVAFSEIAHSFLLDKQHPEGRTSLKIADFPFPFSINIPLQDIGILAVLNIRLTRIFMEKITPNSSKID